MLKSLLFIGGGSFVGGCCRYLLSQLVGFCGGFTTFSTFIQDNYKLIASQQLLMPALYTGLSVVVGYVALYIGLVLAR